MDRTPYSKYNFRFDRLDEQLTFSEIALRHGITSVRGGCFYEARGGHDPRAPSPR